MPRHPGFRLSFVQAVAVAKELFDYWSRHCDTDVWVVWQGERYIGAAATEAGANNLIVRDFARALGAEPREG